MLQCFGPRDRTVLGDMPDEDDRCVRGFGELHELLRDSANLPYASSDTSRLIGGEHADRVYDCERASLGADRLDHAVDIGFVHGSNIPRINPESLGAIREL